MQTGTIVGGRYIIDARIGAGGMGTVYRATDRQSGELVAVKVLSVADPDLHQRFSREIRVLAELSNPAIVRYVGHGTTDLGQPFLAMEWLEGEGLHERLAKRPLTVDETIGIARRAAEALAVAHGEGVVHRDLKPSNLFLVGSDPRRLKVLDFGVARRLAGTRALTGTGAIVGTVGYMAPEQLQGAGDVDARADVFALGCVLFECLTGEPAFPCHNAAAVLAKLLLEDVPRVSALRPDLPEALDDLFARWMATAREERPADAREALAMLDRLGALSGEAPAQDRQASIQPSERRIVNVIVLERKTGPEAATRGHRKASAERKRLAEIVGAHGGELATVGEELLVVLLRGTGAATDLAARAASCALALRDQLPDAKLALTTGRAQTGAQIPVGPAIDAAVELLAEADWQEIRLDVLSANLLGPGFRVAEQVLVGARETDTPARRLLGKPAPFVGRRKELRLLEATLEECIEEGFAQSVLLTAPAGTGKSRLQHEFVARAGEREDLRILRARAEPVGAGSALMLARKLVRSAVESADAEEDGAWARLRRHLGELRLEAPARVAEFLGELAGFPTPDAPSPQLRAARSDAGIMAEWLERSFVDWLAALSERRPLLVALEDVHWGDYLTLSYLDRLVRERGDRAVMVLATARPEVHDAFPQLWGGPALQEVRLQGLGPRASERLVHAVLGDRLGPSEARRLVQLADGNAFYLEELVRHAAEGGGALPETVLAMVESRLGTLEAEARRVLRAASLLGDRFRARGVEALLADESSPVDVPGWLDVLSDRELLERLKPGARGREPTHAFRHALVRETAYGMLTEQDRATGHLLAGEWLEARGETDPRVLLHHFERAGDAERTVRYALQAAQAAIDAGDYREGDRLARIGLARQPEGEDRGRLLLIAATAAGWQGDYEEALCIREAVKLLPAGSSPWTEAVGGALFVGVSLVREDVVREALGALLSFTGRPEITPAYARGVWVATLALMDAGHAPVARQLVSSLQSGLADVEEGAAHGWLEGALSWIFLAYERTPGAPVRHARRAAGVFERLGDPMGLGSALSGTYLALFEAGRLEEALELAARHPTPEIGTHSPQAALLEARSAWVRGDPDAALPAAASVFEAEPRFAGPGRALAALACLELGRRREGEEHLRRALTMADAMSYGPIQVRSGAARFCLEVGDPEEALSHADEGLALAEQGMCYPSTWLALSLARAEALMALGREPEAREAIELALRRLEAARADLPAGEREALVREFPENRRIVELAASWLQREGEG